MMNHLSYSYVSKESLEDNNLRLTQNVKAGNNN